VHPVGDLMGWGDLDVLETRFLEAGSVLIKRQSPRDAPDVASALRAICLCQ